MATQRETIEAQNAALEERLKEITSSGTKRTGKTTFIGGLGEALSAKETAIKKLTEARSNGDLVEQLDPSIIRPSRFANRLPARFSGPKHLELRNSVQALGKNQIPILVRPIAGDDQFSYELVFGHRRHRACSELGIKVRAFVQELTDLELTHLMDLENKARDDLSAYEEALFLSNLLREFPHEYPNQKSIAKKTDRSEGYVSLLLGMLTLPDLILSSFSDPTEIRMRWVQSLLREVKSDREAMLARAEQVRSMNPRPSDEEVFDLLVGKKGERKPSKTRLAKEKPRPAPPVKHGRRKVMTYTKRAEGGYRIALTGVVPDEIARDLIQSISAELLDRLEAAGVPK